MGAMHVLEFAFPPPCVDRRDLRLHVVYTTPDATRACLKAASLLASDLGATLDLLVPHVVPFPLPLDEPAAPASFIEDTVTALIKGYQVDINVKVLLCRDREETIPKWLPSDSIVVIGRRRRWGLGEFRPLIRAVKRGGHHVVVVDAGHNETAAAALCRRLVSR